MNSDRRAWILDVGHGNSTVVEDSNHVSIIDGGQKETLMRFLDERRIHRIDTIIVSHADADHFGGISLLLANSKFQVGQVFVNPDPRNSKVWEDFVSVMVDAKRRGVKFELEITNVNPGKLFIGETKLEVMAPSQEIAYRTAIGRTADGKQLSSNSMSVVVRVWARNSPRLLIPGDIDQVGLECLKEQTDDIKAEVLVFPHHGGLPGKSNAGDFAQSLVKSVDAKFVIFSIGRGRYGTPRPEIVEAVRRNSRNVHVACTQLSKHCARDLPLAGNEQLIVVAEGNRQNACCAGTISVSLDDEFAYAPARRAHQQFVNKNAPTALCVKHIVSTAN